MKRCGTWIIGLVLGLSTLPAFANRVLEGVAPSGAHYIIEVPDGWQSGGPLMLYQHGLNFEAIDDDPSLGPLREIVLAEGYAIAASGFRQRGWALFGAIDDNRELLAIFRAQVGEPGELVPFGGSMGGLIALRLAEQADLRSLIRGVLALCPAAAGSRAWDSGFDLRLAYDAVCAGVDGAELHAGSPPFPWAYDLDDIPGNLGDLEHDPDVIRALLSVTICTGIPLPESLRTSAMRQRAQRLRTLTGITDDDFLLTNIAYSTFVMSDLVRAPDKLAGRNPFGNIGVDYGDAALNAAIERIEPDRLAALRFRGVTDFRGDIGNAKIVSLHTSKDELVFASNQSILRERVPASQLLSAIVSEQESTHCGFSNEEGVAGWEALRAWKDGGAKPEVADLQARCIALGGAEGSGCRFDANAQVADFDATVAPRPDAVDVDGRFSGQWFDPQRDGEGFAVEVLDAHQALVYFFTYPPVGQAGAQSWLVGTGRIETGGIIVDQLVSARRAADGTVHRTPWGSLELSFTDCEKGNVRWVGPAGWGTHEGALQRITSLYGIGCDPATQEVNNQVSGSWFDPSNDGSGLVMEQLARNLTLAMYFGFDSGGNPMWMGGLAQGDPTAGMTIDLVRTRGPHFGEDYDPRAVVREIGGRLTQVALGCANGTATLQRTDVPPDFITGAMALTRLTTPLGVPHCQ